MATLQGTISVISPYFPDFRKHLPGIGSYHPRLEHTILAPHLVKTIEYYYTVDERKIDVKLAERRK